MFPRAPTGAKSPSLQRTLKLFGDISVFVTVGEFRRPNCFRQVALPPIMPAANGDRTESRVKMTRMRLRIAERLKSAQNTAAMLTTFQEVSVYVCMHVR